MSIVASSTNPQAAADAMTAEMFKMWLVNRPSAGEDEKGDTRSAAPVSGGGKLGAIAAGMGSAAAPMADLAMQAASSADVPLSMVGGAMAATPPNTDLMAVARSASEPTGPMQISQQTWNSRVLPLLSDADKQKIAQLTGKPADSLNMNDLKDNIVGGVFAIKAMSEANGGNMQQAVRDYVSKVLGLDLNSAQSISAEAAFIAAMNELERKQAIKPRPAPTSGSMGSQSHQDRSAGGGGNGGGGGVQGAGANQGSARVAGGDAGARSASGAENDAANAPANVTESGAPQGTPDLSSISDKMDLKNPQLAKWEKEILAASKISGTPPAVIAAQMWHESRGNPNVRTTNSDGSGDLGLMQIGQQRWQGYARQLTAEQRSMIKEVTGLDASQLDMNNPLHNVIGGAVELQYWLKQAHGDLRGALNGYVSGSVHGGNGIGDPNYASNCLRYVALIEQGKPLPDQG